MKSTISATIPMRQLHAAAVLSDRYVYGRFLPDKAIDLLDEAGAMMRISMMNQPLDISKFEAEIEEARLAKEEAISANKSMKRQQSFATKKSRFAKSCSRSALSGKQTAKSMKFLSTMKMWQLSLQSKQAFQSIA